jgi:radical SAM superfamily enzyme YgiQ (UPF0313 family)
MNIYLSDLVHNHAIGNNQISGDLDFVVPLNIAGLAAYAKNCFADEDVIQLFKYPNALLDAAKLQSPDVMGFSNYCWSADLNHRIGSLMRERCPEMLTVMGGPGIRTDAKGIEMFLKKNRFVDVYIMYEGEVSFVEVLRRYKREGRRFLKRGEIIPGCAFLYQDSLRYSSSVVPGNIEQFPSPYLAGLLDPFLEEGFIPLFETNRGCPFACTFCVWGISALNKVRKFPLERVFAEMDHVAAKFPEIPAWIIADANFGMLPRDVDIAKKIRAIREKSPTLQNILTWESKNTSERNFEIARIMKHDFGDALIAVQTLDEKAQEAVRRKNIRLSDIPQKIEAFKKAGARVGTHVLSGLSGETLDGHFETLRKCFDLGFDHVDVFSTLLLPGSEMETEVSRKKYQIKTKYRTRQGAYGDYQGIKSIESEEIIRGTSSISEEEMRSLRRVHWLVWYGWNHGFLKPAMQYAHALGINPLNLISELSKPDRKRCPSMWSLFEDFSRDADTEWFDSPEELHAYYTSPKCWGHLLEDGFSKVEFVYTSHMILDRRLFEEFLDWMFYIIQQRVSSCLIADVLKVMREIRIEPDDFFGGDLKQKTISVDPDISLYVSDSGGGAGQSSLRGNKPGGRKRGTRLILKKPSESQKRIRSFLERYGYARDKRFAVEKTLGAISDAFYYDITVTDEHEAVTQNPEAVLSS